MGQLQFLDKKLPLKAAQTEFDSLLKKPQTSVFIRLSLVLLIISWAIYGLFYRFLPPQLPLFFSMPWGEDQLVNKQLFIIVPTVATVCFIINIRLASVFINRDHLVSQMLLWGQLLVSFLSFVTIVQIVRILA